MIDQWNTLSSDARKLLVRVLSDIIRNDKTFYLHHEARPWDGRNPDGGTIWKTPREIAAAVLRSLDARLPDPIKETMEDSP